jgi:uncharacterized protein YjbI with pentapeptide repeats
MANEGHVALIKQGVKVWNKWREENPDIMPDLNSAILSDANLIGVDLSNVDLNGAHFISTNLRYASFRFANLDCANLRNASLKGTNFRRASLKGANLSYANLECATLLGASLKGANLHRAILKGANLERALLLDADLNGADLRHALLKGANLERSLLCDTDLRSADLHYANFNGASLKGADLSHALLYGTDLRGAMLADTNFNSADLRAADLRTADLNGANLDRALLHGADLSNASLNKANFFGADLTNTNLAEADLSETNLQRATFIDSYVDGANLTDARLWEMQRDGWSIRNIACQRAFWDRNGEEPTEYEDGAFERIFAEKPRIVLHYQGGMSPVDLAMLPLIIERLQAEHPGCALHIRSVQDEGSGAAVTITVDDLAGRSAEAFAQDVEFLRGDLAIVQQRLQQEERLRLEAEVSYRAMVRDIVPMLLEKALLRTEVNVGQITGPTIIEGTTMSRDTYKIHGQAGAVGPKALAHDNTFQQVQNQGALDLPRLAEELGQLRVALKRETDDAPEADEAIGAVASAQKAADVGDGAGALQHLKTAGRWAFGIAEKIGVSVAAEAIKRAMPGV